MVDKIGGPTHNILIAEDSSQAIRADTEKALTGLTKAKRGSDDKSTVLSQSTWQRRLVSIPKRLTGSYGTYVKQQNELVKTAFAKALGVNSRDIAGAGAAHKAIFKSLDQSAFPRPNWTLSPRQTDHPVHAKLIGQSMANWTASPDQTDHP